MVIDLEDVDLKEIGDIYHKNEPFPHVVLDNIFHDESLKDAKKAFPKIGEISWYRYDNVFENKYACNELNKIPQQLRDVIRHLNSPFFLCFLRYLTNIQDLSCDENLHGGGLHCIGNRGKLDVHADFNIHPILKKYRRVNVLLFLNKEWEDHYNGNLELWDKNMEKCVKSIKPLFNRMVIFSISDVAYHGHPIPLNCPEHVYRKSIATYYYSKTPGNNQENEYHSTLYKKMPSQETSKEIENLREKRGRGRLQDIITSK